jgi:hypothetical protein
LQTTRCANTRLCRHRRSPSRLWLPVRRSITGDLFRAPGTQKARARQIGRRRMVLEKRPLETRRLIRRTLRTPLQSIRTRSPIWRLQKSVHLKIAARESAWISASKGRFSGHHNLRRQIHACKAPEIAGLFPKGPLSLGDRGRVADDAVLCKPVSGVDSLLTGKRTGYFRILAASC